MTCRNCKKEFKDGDEIKVVQKGVYSSVSMQIVFGSNEPRYKCAGFCQYKDLPS